MEARTSCDMSSFNEASAQLCVKALTHDDITMAIMYLSPVSFLSSFLSLSLSDLYFSLLPGPTSRWTTSFPSSQLPHSLVPKLLALPDFSTQFGAVLSLLSITTHVLVYEILTVLMITLITHVLITWT